MTTATATQVKRYRVDVLGEIWEPGAGLCSYQYTMEQDHKPTPEEVKRRAGDFQTVTDFRVWGFVACDHCGVSHLGIIRDWKDEESQESWDARPD